MSGALKNFHLPLPRETYERLKEEAAREDRPATAVAREVIEGWLDERRRLTVRGRACILARARQAGLQRVARSEVGDLAIALRRRDGAARLRIHGRHDDIMERTCLSAFL